MITFFWFLQKNAQIAVCKNPIGMQNTLVWQALQNFTTSELRDVGQFLASPINEQKGRFKSHLSNVGNCCKKRKCSAKQGIHF